MSSPHLPPETLDQIVDLFHDDRETLKQFSTVSRSLTTRTRIHLFNDVAFSSDADVEAWKGTFPDPANSPAHCVRFLSVGCPEVISTAHTGEGGLVRSFSNVVRLNVYTPSTPFSRIFTLIQLLPLLEDLKIWSDPPFKEELKDQIILQPPTSPPLTGTLVIRVPGAQNCCRPKEILEHLARQLLALPNSINFRELVCSWNLKRDIRWTMALVEACLDTLERVSFTWFSAEDDDDDEVEGTPLVDLTKALKLKHVIFRGSEPLWITMALKTITPKHEDLQLTIQTYYHSGYAPDADNAKRERWMDLDRVLVKLWESHAIRTTVTHGGFTKEEADEYFGRLLPETMRRGIISFLVDCDDDDDRI